MKPHLFRMFESIITRRPGGRLRLTAMFLLIQSCGGGGAGSVFAPSAGPSASAPTTATAPTLTRFVLTPPSVALVSGATQRFAVSAAWSDGSTTPPATTYSATGGTITPSGLYTAGSTAGSFTVVATQQGGTRADAATVIISVPTATLLKMVLTPATLALAPGGIAQFAVAGSWSDGSSAPPTVTYSATGGTITAGGLYTAGATQGSFRVIATQQGGTKADTATVTVLAAASSSCARTVNASTMTGLVSALANALPGDCILLATGTYGLDSGLVISRSGTVSAPIVVQGQGSGTIIQVNQRAFFVDGNYVQLRRLRITNFNTVGLWLRGVTGVVLDSLEVDHTLQEAVALKFGSHDNIVSNSWIHDTGIQTPQFGEGVYVGGKTQDGLGLDYSATGNQVLNNHFGPNVRAEGVDVKEGADSTFIRGNFFDGTGAVFINYATVSLINVVANYVTIDSNYLQYGDPEGVSFVQGVGTMTGNVATSNTIDLQNIHNYTGQVVGFQFQAGTVGGAIVSCNNVMVSGILSNRPCAP